MHRFVLFALLTLTLPLLAQTVEISECISDPSGLPIPSATVNIQSRETVQPAESSRISRVCDDALFRL